VPRHLRFSSLQNAPEPTRVLQLSRNYTEAWKHRVCNSVSCVFSWPPESGSERVNAQGSACKWNHMLTNLNVRSNFDVSLVAPVHGLLCKCLADSRHLRVWPWQQGHTMPHHACCRSMRLRRLLLGNVVQVADFLHDAGTVTKECRALGALCSCTDWENAAALRSALLERLQPHHQSFVFVYLATLVPLNALLTTLPYDLVPLLVAALVHNGGGAASSEPGAFQGAGQPRSALLLPASRARQPWGATALAPAAYSRLFKEVPALPALTAVSLEGQRLGGVRVRAAAMALQAHVQLTLLDLRGNALDAFGVRALAQVLPRWPALGTLLLSDNELLSSEAADARWRPVCARWRSSRGWTLRSVIMTDALHAALAPLTLMQKLELGTPRVGDALRGMVHLSHLDLSLPDWVPVQECNVDLGDDEAARLAYSLCVHTALRCLRIANIRENMSRFAFASWPLLQHLDVAGLQDEALDAGHWHQFGPSMRGDKPAPPDSTRRTGVHSIARLTQLTHLRIGIVQPSIAQMDGYSRVIAALPQLQRLESCSWISERGGHDVVAPGYAHAFALQELRLQMCQDRPLAPASGHHSLTQLKKLHLSVTCFVGHGQGGWHKLAADVLQLEQLTSLTWAMKNPRLGACTSLTGLFASIVYLQRLQELCIKGADLSADAAYSKLPRLTQVLPCLTSLQLQGCRLSAGRLGRMQSGKLKLLAV
jgi:hypothetical protein